MNSSPPTHARSLDARAVALDLLGQVLERGMPLDTALARARPLAALSTRDRAFARLLVTTVLRRLGQIDGAIAEKLNRPLAPRQSQVRNALRLGIAQLAFLGTPAHAAVDRSVALVRQRGRGGMTGLVNAVLRAIDRDGAAALADTPETRALNTPDWLQASWRAAYGAENTHTIMAVHAGEPPLDITLAPGEPAEAWADRLEATLLPTGTLRRRAGGTVSALADYDRGAWWVQDAAAALPARLLGDFGGRHVIDLCAAPGGKTAQLAAAGAQVTAVDISAERLALVQENLARLHLAAEVICADATEFAPAHPADAILVDAPCSSTGTIRRHPDIAWLKSPDDVAAAAQLQARLLRAAIEMLAPGGTLVYAVCSLQPEEGPAQVAALLGDRGDIARVPVTPPELPGLDALSPPVVTADGDVRTLPCHLADAGGMDGFYIARLRRR